MTLNELINQLQKFQKKYGNYSVYVADCQGDDALIQKVFPIKFNNWDGKAGIFISDGGIDNHNNY